MTDAANIQAVPAYASPDSRAEAIAALRAYEILDTSPEPAFDDIARLAAAFCRTPIALINFVDERRQFFKAHIGVEICEVPLQAGFCPRVVATGAPLVIPDTAVDAACAENPLLIGNLPVRFYAGVPLVTDQGLSIGTLAVIDHIPHDMSLEQVTVLEMLGRQVVAQMELRRVQQEWRRREALYQTLGEAVPDFVWSCGAKGEPIFVNQRWTDYTGLTLEHAGDIPADVMHHPDDYPGLVAVWKQAVANREPYEAEFRFRRHDGVYRWFSTRVIPVKDAHGEIVQWIGTSTDIHERKGTEEALKRSEARYRRLTEAIPQLVWTTTPDGIPDYFNERWYEYTAYQVTRDPAANWAYLLHPDDQARAATAWQRAVETGEPYEVEYRLRRRDGAFHWFLVRGLPIRDERGQITQWLGTCTDIDVFRRAETARREEARISEALYRIGMLLAEEHDLQRLIQIVTDESTALCGAEFGSFFYNVIGAGGEAYLLYTLSGASQEAFNRFPMPRNTALFAPTFAGEGIVRSDDVTRDPRYGQSAPYYGMPPGHLPVCSYLAVPVVSRSGEVIGGLFFGHSQPGVFTARHERVLEGLAAQAAIAIDNVRLYQAERERSEQLALAIQEVHHRCKNSLQGVSNLLEMQISPDSDVVPVEAVEDALGQIKTIALVYDLLARDKPISTVDVSRVLTNLAELLAPGMRSKEQPLPVHVDVEPLWIPTKAATSLALAVNECCVNAAKHYHPIDRGAQDTDAIEIKLRRRDDHIHLVIQDAGPGFPPGFDPEKDAHIGLQLVQVLVTHDLCGTVSFSNRTDSNRTEATHGNPSSGARVEIVFSEHNLPD